MRAFLRAGAAAVAVLLAASLATARQAADPRTLTAQADEAFARDDYETAEPLYRRAIDAGAEGTHALSRLAQLLTWKGEYKEAIALYRRALDRDPRGLEPRRGLATAYTWSEDYSSALALYDQLLSERPGDEGLTFEMAQAQAWSGDFPGATRSLRSLLDRNPRHLKARVLLGQVRLWSGDLPQAEQLFTAALAEDPANVDALTGLGRVRSAQGRYDDALAQFDQVLAAHPKNRSALEGRAEALHLQGRGPEALSAVRQALELYPDARDARRIGRDIGGPLRPNLQLNGSTTQDSDDNDLAQWGGSYTHHFGASGYAGASFQHAQTEATFGLLTPVARYDTLRAIGGVHFSPHISLYGELGPERTDFPYTGSDGEHENRSASHVAGSLTLEVNPAAWLTLVGGVSQESLVGTSQAFMNDVRLRAATLTAVFRPHPSLRLRASGQRAGFLDADGWDVDGTFTTVADADRENARDLVLAGAQWRTPLRRPRLFLNYNMRWMSYDENLDQGYFDPDHYVSQLVGFDVSDMIGPHIYWGVGMDTGVQVIDGWSTTDAADVHDRVLSYRLLAGLNLGDSAALEAYYARSDLAAQTTTGFKSTEAGLRLKFRFGPVLGPAAPARDIAD